MNSKQRILSALRHQPLDRVPVSTYEIVAHKKNTFYTTDPSYSNLVSYIKEKTDCIFYMYETRNPSNPGIFETLEWQEGNDTYSKDIIHTPDRDLVCLKKKMAGIETWWTLEHYCKDLDDMRAYMKILDHRAGRVDMTEVYREQAELGNQGIMSLSPADPIGEAAWLFEMGSFLIYSITETEEMMRFMDAIFEVQMDYLRQILKGDVSEIMFRICGPEYATPPYLSPRMFNDFVTPYLITMCREIKEAGGIPRIHCHGKIKEALKEFMKTDMMALDPIEPPPDGNIELSEVKRLCGDRVCLMGNMELKELEHASGDRIRELVKKAMEDAKGTTGYIFTTTAAPINTPLSPHTEDNYHHMIEAALEYGKY
ncbi:MAG: uroporphyrinogen decarboxylase family protein [Clostridia bacterium]